VIDIYRGRTTPTSNLVDYALFVSFFPLLIAGPIERATHLLPQIQKPRHFNLSDASNGLRQILWGLFKKIVIADGCAVVANTVFSSPEELNGSTLLLGAVMFSFQIYGDFSGYSDMALGIAKLFGFDLLKNFSYPYFSRDIAEFWRRWHISLSSWFKDYVYIPLGGSKQGKKKAIRNTFIIFLLSGFWHGANWTFVIWGGLHALYFLPLLLSNKNRKNIDLVAKDSLLPSAKEFFQIVITFFLVTFAWISFRAESLHQAIVYISGIFSFSLFQTPTITPKLLLLVLLIFIIIEWKGRSYSYALANMGTKWSTPVRWAMYCLIGLIILVLKGASQQFIYFQF
jgi:D-alanyl-lipoteichoic acid acyltransferase DltB (MBOAT superfamily)